MWPRRLTGPPRTRRAAVDLHDLASFRAAATRAWLLRVAFGGAAVALVVASAAAARDLDARPSALIPSGTTGVAVVDLSLSIEDDQYRLVRRAFRRLIAENASIGLVVFSDIPYELLPPGTPAAELRPMLRLLVPPRRGAPVNPWADTFRSGTRISTALLIARDMLQREGVRSGSILLVSDLDTAPDDVPALTRIVESIRGSSNELRVVGLAPSSDGRLIFEGLLQEKAFETTPPGSESSAGGSDSAAGRPTTLLILAALALVALAAHEHFAGRVAITEGHA